MIRAAASQTIDRPVEEVYAFVTDAANEPRWHTDVLEVNRTSDGPVAPGSTYRWVVDFMGRKDMHLRVAELEPNRREVLQATAGPMLPTITYEFEPGDGDSRSTRFTRNVEIAPTGFLRVMAPLMRGMIAKRNAAFVDNLKRVLES